MNEFLFTKVKSTLFLQSSSVPENFETSDVSNKFTCIVSNFKISKLLLLSKNDRDDLQQIVSFLKYPVMQPTLKAFIEKFDFERCPLEFVYILHSNGIIQVTTFLYFHPKFGELLSDHLVNILFTDYSDDVDKQLIEKIYVHLLSALINVGGHSLRSLFTSVSAVLEATFHKIVVKIDNKESLVFDIYKGLQSEQIVLPSQLKLFTISLLNSFLIHASPSVSFSSALSIHYKKWMYNALLPSVQTVFEKVFLILSVKDIFREIDIAVAEQNINLKYLLILLSLLCNKSSEIQEAVRAKGEDWFKLALNDRNEFNLGLGLLVIRHHCSLMSNQFTNYANWFGSLPVKSPQSYSFLFKFLSKLVPFESPLFLKIHVTRVPSAPPSCQQVQADYIQLAKTRLSDLNEPIEYMGLFNDFHETFEEQQKSDLNRILKQFSAKKEIPNALKEAFMLRKQFYDKIFLPYLLSVPESADPVRGELIKLLQAAGKIPSTAYRNWKKL